MTNAMETHAWRLANLYKVSLALFALEETGVLARLSGRPATATTLACELDLRLEVLEPVLDLLAAEGGLARDAEAFVLSESGAALLPLVALEARMARTRLTAENLALALRGHPLGDPMDGDAAPWPLFLAAMAAATRTLAPHLVRAIRPAPGARVLDLGGADGALAQAMLRLVPELRVTVVDRPQVADAFERRVAEPGAAHEPDRVRFVGCDLRHCDRIEDTFAQYDAFVLSNVIHLLSDAARAALLGAIRRRARSGAVLCVYDQFLTAKESGAARCQVVDWALCGCRFDDEDAGFVAQLGALGFEGARSRRVPGMPGAIVVATT